MMTTQWLTLSERIVSQMGRSISTQAWRYCDGPAVAVVLQANSQGDRYFDKGL